MQEVRHTLTTEEELFCTRYELETLSGIVNYNRLERWVPGFCNSHTHQEHVARYDWVKDFVKDKIVLDIACGTGFGSYKLLVEGGAASVTGYDNDERTIRYASLKNTHANLFFKLQDAESFGSGEQYDIIVSFETVEHLKQPEKFLTNINRSLVANGTCFISTPISGTPENDHPDNIYHQREWGFGRFRELVKNFLTIEEVYLQLNDAGITRNDFLSRVLQKTGLKQNDRLHETLQPEPRKWDPQEIKEELVGTQWTGYQLLQCRKKTDAGR
jgi:2-polyprenyl-3-methyl-5-hydroxy-6-metoxy-1,4-benzoquinol methylase